MARGDNLGERWLMSVWWGVLALLAAQAAAPPTAVQNADQDGAGPPVPVVDDTPDEIAKDSARDLKDRRFFNKPGATRADYDRDWQQCRLIARGSVTPGGMPVVVYNPAVISPAAAAGGGIIGAMIGQAIVEGEQRRANRRTCLLFRGWRLVEVDAAEEARLGALDDAAREAHFNRVLGAETVDGEITSWTNNFADPVLPAGVAR